MARYQRIVTTEAGLQLLAAAVAGGTVTFTVIKTGSGTYAATENLVAVTDLRSVRQTFGVSSVTRTGAQVKLRSVLTNDNISEGYRMTEIGLYAKNPNTGADILYAIIIAESGFADYFPPFEQAPASITMEFFIELTEVESGVTFTVEAMEGALVPVESFNEHVSSEIHITAAERTAWNAKLGDTGNASDTTAAFTEATTLAALTTGSKLSVLFGTLAKAVSSLISHLANTSNPHTVTKAQVGLGNVPNVATNEQTPTYTAASANTALTSGEALSTAFGKIAKAISSLISHLADSVSHITAAERTTWNSKANGTHTHTKSQITDFPTSLPASDVSAWAKATTKPTYTKSEVGLGSVDNTADANKSVKYATSAGNADTLDGLHAASFIQTSQSVKVIVSTTAPADTTAVWIVPS